MEQITGNGKYQYNHTRKRQAKFQVNGIYYALPYGKVKGLLTVKVLKCYTNSAMVEVVESHRKIDKPYLESKSNVIVVPFKKMELI